jgi:hypothetical protein
MASIDQLIGVILAAFPILVRNNIEARGEQAIPDDENRRKFSILLDGERAKCEMQSFLSNVAPSGS